VMALLVAPWLVGLARALSGVAAQRNEADVAL
jgi:hypothetical protein